MNTVQRQYNYEESSALIPSIKKKYCLKSPITKIFNLYSSVTIRIIRYT